MLQPNEIGLHPTFKQLPENCLRTIQGLKITKDDDENSQAKKLAEIKLAYQKLWDEINGEHGNLDFYTAIKVSSEQKNICQALWDEAIRLLEYDPHYNQASNEDKIELIYQLIMPGVKNLNLPLYSPYDNHNQEEKDEKKEEEDKTNYDEKQCMLVLTDPEGALTLVSVGDLEQYMISNNLDDGYNSVKNITGCIKKGENLPGLTFAEQRQLRNQAPNFYEKYVTNVKTAYASPTTVLLIAHLMGVIINYDINTGPNEHKDGIINNFEERFFYLLQENPHFRETYHQFLRQMVKDGIPAWGRGVTTTHLQSMKLTFIYQYLLNYMDNLPPEEREQCYKLQTIDGKSMHGQIQEILTGQCISQVAYYIAGTALAYSPAGFDINNIIFAQGHYPTLIEVCKKDAKFKRGDAISRVKKFSVPLSPIAKAYNPYINWRKWILLSIFSLGLLPILYLLRSGITLVIQVLFNIPRAISTQFLDNPNEIIATISKVSMHLLTALKYLCMALLAPSIAYLDIRWSLGPQLGYIVAPPLNGISAPKRPKYKKPASAEKKATEQILTKEQKQAQAEEEAEAKKKAKAEKNAQENQYYEDMQNYYNQIAQEDIKLVAWGYTFSYLCTFLYIVMLSCIYLALFILMAPALSLIANFFFNILNLSALPLLANTIGIAGNFLALSVINPFLNIIGVTLSSHCLIAATTLVTSVFLICSVATIVVWLVNTIQTGITALTNKATQASTNSENQIIELSLSQSPELIERNYINSNTQANPPIGYKNDNIDNINEPLISPNSSP